MQLKLYGNHLWLYHQPIDFRCSIDGLLGIITAKLNQKPQEGVYIFYNRARDKLKCLSWHRNGYLLFYKRLESGRFCFYPSLENNVMEISVEELGWVLAGLEWQKMRDWGELSFDKFS